MGHVWAHPAYRKRFPAPGHVKMAGPDEDDGAAPFAGTDDNGDEPSPSDGDGSSGDDEAEMPSESAPADTTPTDEAPADRSESYTSLGDDASLNEGGPCSLVFPWPWKPASMF